MSVLSPSLNPAWTAPSTAGSVRPFSLPPHTVLILADVDAGSNTPSMVGKVMQWKKAAPEESERVWSELGRSNEALRDVFAELSDAAKKDASAYEREVARLAGATAKEVSFLRRSSAAISLTPLCSQWSSSPSPFAAAAERILVCSRFLRNSSSG